jgi:hypothetical protein
VARRRYEPIILYEAKVEGVAMNLVPCRETHIASTPGERGWHRYESDTLRTLIVLSSTSGTAMGS